MMENYFDTIIVFNDVGVTLRDPIESCSHHRKLYSDISRLQEVLFDKTTIICGSFIQNHQGCSILRTDVQPHHYFLYEISFLLNVTSFIHISPIYCPHSSISSSVEAINITELFIQQENFQGVCFSEAYSNPVSELFPSVLLIIEK